MKRELMPAFPIPPDFNQDGQQMNYGSHGLTKLEWFAGQALSGIMGNPNCEPRTSQHLVNIAVDAVQVAINTIAELEKHQ